MTALPELAGVSHRYVELGGGVTIHVAEAGPADGPPVMLIHGFPQNWWEWQAVIGPLAADGYRVLCPDLRGAGWSSAPADRYLKSDMADDLARVLDRLAVGPVRLVAHDWGGPVATIMMLQHPERVSGFFGLNTSGPWFDRDAAVLHDLWRFWYQVPILVPVIGPRVVGDPRGRFLRFLCRWVGAGFLPPDMDMYVAQMGEPGHAVAGSRWYRAAQTADAPRWMRGEYAETRIDVPVRFLHGLDDPVIKPLMTRPFQDRATDFRLETVDGAGHWIVEQRPELVLDRLRAFLRETDGARETM
jgi:pimeloyl-ACP methyl ester carboxylesterase